MAKRFLALALFLLAYVSFSSAATGWRMFDANTIMLFNDAAQNPYYISTGGIQVANQPSNETPWSKNYFCLEATGFPQTCVNDTSFSYKIVSDNSTYANVSFTKSVGGYRIRLDYNLSKYDTMISIKPQVRTGQVSGTRFANFSWRITEENVGGDPINDEYWYNDIQNPWGTVATIANGSSKALFIFDTVNYSSIVLRNDGKYPRLLNATSTYVEEKTIIGRIFSNSLYEVPFAWNDADPVCDIGLVQNLVCSQSSSNVTGQTALTLSLVPTKDDASATCTYTLRHKPASQLVTVTSNFVTTANTRPQFRITDGTANPLTTSSLSPSWTGRAGATNSTKVIQPHLEASVTTSGAKCNFTNTKVWDVFSPNVTMNTSNWTNTTDGILRAMVWVQDDVNIANLQLWVNNSGWAARAYQNRSPAGGINYSFQFNFTINGLPDGCYLVAAGAQDTNNNTLNMTQNYTICVNTTVASSGYSIQEDPLSCNFPTLTLNQTLPIACTSNNGTGAQITNSLIRCQAYWASNVSTAALSVQAASDASHKTNGTYLWNFNPPLKGACYYVNCSAAFAVTANAPAAPGGIICTLPDYAQQDNTSQIRADMALNTSAIINNNVVGNNSIHVGLALNTSLVLQQMAVNTSSIQASINAKLMIQASPAQSFYNNSDLLIEFAFSNNTGAFATLDTLSIQLVQANGTVYNATYATTVGLVNGTYLYNVSINENNSGIWTVRVNATKNGITAISSYNLRLYGGVFMFSITTDQNVYDTVTGTIFLLNEGADNTEDGTLETWISISATCAPIMDGTYASEQLKPPAIGSSKLVTRQKTIQRTQDTLYYCGKWTYADFQTATATAAFTISVVGGGWFGSALLPTLGGIPPSIASCEKLEGFDEFVCNLEVWLTGRDLSYSKTGYIPNFLIIIAALGFFIFVLYKRKHPKISILLSIIIVVLLLRYFGRA